MKRIKELLILMLTIVIILYIPSISLAGNDKIDSQAISYEEFIKAQEDGYIGEDITYEDMVNFSIQSLELEKELDNNDSFLKVHDSSNSRNMSKSISLKSGDVIITNDTIVFGITGHAAIALSSDKILDIPGPKEPVRTQTVSKFINSYKKGWIKVYRPTNSTWGSKAATWAKTNYEGSKATYKINNEINSTKETYCSKIVFQAYKFGVGRTAFKTYEHSQGGGYYANDYDLKSGMILPYGLPVSMNINYLANLN